MVEQSMGPNDGDFCDEADADTCQHHIVGVGASAGGLEALEALFGSMPSDSGMSFVVVQHLSPDFESHMDDLLRRVTDMPVEVAKDRLNVEPNTIYLIPPKKEMVINNGQLLLTERSTEKVLSLPINQFFRSLAQDAGRYSIGIILSGTGGDGSRGIIDIADARGLVLAQDPASCKFDSMPMSAQETGRVHLVLPAQAMAEALQRYVVDGETPKQLQEKQISTLEGTGLKRVFQLLHRGHQIDFTNYKPGTVYRRIQRRIELLGYESLDQYIERVERDPAEVNDLYKDLLIGVTRFFRDQEAFDFFESEIIPQLMAQSPEKTIRIWVCGCASGEEAYSIAILMIEAIERSGQTIDFKMFATDAHRESLQFAATGVYPESKMDDVSPSRRERFFRKRPDGYYVTPEVRRRIVFAPHNVISDPPFTQMHLVTCRNLLIYFQPSAQQKTISLFHFALKPKGILFLGPSESPGHLNNEFEALQKHWKIFRKSRDVRLPIETRLPLSSKSEIRGLDAATKSELSAPPPTECLPQVYDALLGEIMPPSILIDSSFQVLHAFPGSEPYLRYPSGRPTTNVLEIIYPAVRNSIAAAVQHALKDDSPVRYSGMPHPVDPNQSVGILIRTIDVPSSTFTPLIIQFELSEVEKADVDELKYREVDMNSVAANRIETLQQELSFTRQNLQATIEELETSNEELQATNEEMVASNEELQSTNEELHSVNEELFTVNAEHQKHVTELNESNSDMHNLLATTRVGVVFLDRELRIRRYTPEISKILYLEQSDLGRRIDEFIAELDDSDFVNRLEGVLQSRHEVEWEVRAEGRAYLLRAMPYWNSNSIAGVVIAFVDVSAMKRTEAELAQFKFMADENFDGQLLINEDARVIYANRAAASALGYSVNEMLGKAVTFFDSAHGFEQFRDRFEEARQKRGIVFESTFLRKDTTEFAVEISATFVELNGVPYLFWSVRNITQRLAREAERRMLQEAIASVENGIAIYDTSDNHLITFVNDGFTRMTGYEADEVLGRSGQLYVPCRQDDLETRKTLQQAFENKTSCRVQSHSCRKDGSKFWNDFFLTPVMSKAGEVINFVGISTDVTEQIRIGEEAKDKERTMRLLMNSTAEGIYGVDSDGVCTFCNSAAAKMLGYDDPDRITGESIHRLIQPKVIDSTESDQVMSIAEAVKEGEELNLRTESFTRADGTSFPVEVWCHPVKVNGKLQGAVVTFVDDTIRQQRELELHNAKDSADAANQAKSRFLANMSHELRTPLAAILGFTEILRQEYSDLELQDKLSAIHRNGDYLLKLLGDILDLSRIEAGKLTTSSEVVALDQLLGDIRDTMVMRTVEYQNQLHFELQGKLPSTVTTDAARLRQVLINLIANAIKFTPKGRVDVIVSSQDTAGTNALLVVEISDNGIGMSSEQLEKLFQPFQQADDTIAERFGGTGLGLSITKRLVAALGGSIHAESTLGSGSKFTVRVPVYPIGSVQKLSLVQSTPTKESAELEAEVTSLNARVLIADDMRDVRFIAQHFMSKVGCEVEVAENGQLAVNAVNDAIEEGNPYQLVLMDLQMPVMDGVQAVTHLREQGHELPIIALTADAMKGTRRKLLAAGFDDYLTKPIKPKSLLRAAKKLLDRQS